MTRKFTAKGTTSLTVKAADGSRPASPQTLLDGLMGSLSFDPLEFSRQDAKKQTNTLKELVGLDTSEIDAEIAGAENNRLETGREFRRLEGALQIMPQKYEGIPGNEASATALADELDTASDLAAKKAELERDMADLKATALADAAHIKIAEEVIKQQQEIINSRTAAGKACKQDFLEKKAAAEAIEVPDTQAIRNRMITIEDDNKKIRANAARAEADSALGNADHAHISATHRIGVLRDKRRKAIEALKFPVDGLSLDETGVQFGGIPFEQASSSEQLRVSVAMGLSQHPTLKLLLIRDGSLLDEANLTLIGDMAEKAGAQVLVERVGTDAHTSVVIEDGMVLDTEAA